MFEKVKKLFKKEPKYKTRFEANAIKIYDPSEQDVYEAKASYQNLKAFLPKDIDFDRSYDLLGVSFSAYVSSRANRNSQMVSGADAKALAPLFLRRPINKEHNRKETIGVITNYGFSEFGTERPLTEQEVDELIAKEEPFNVNLGGVLWKVCDSDYIENLVAVNNSDSSSRPYCCSWEISFSEFQIAEGSKNLSEARIISDSEEIEGIYKELHHFSGGGVNPKTGLPIYLLLTGSDSLQSLGIGITKSPAGPVGPLLTTEHPLVLDVAEINANDLEEKEEDDESDEDSDDCPDDCECEDCKKELEEIESKIKTTIQAFSKEVLSNDELENRLSVIKKVSLENSNILKDVLAWQENEFESKYYELAASQEKTNDNLNKNKKSENNLEKIEKVSVNELTASNSQEKTNRKQTSMKLTKIDQLTDEALTKGEVTASIIADFFSEEIGKIGTEWAAKEKEKENALAAIEDEKNKLASELESLRASAFAIQEELAQVKSEALAREKAEAFQVRLSGINDQYSLSDEEKQVVAEQIKDLDSDGFDKWVKAFEIFAKGKMKQGEKDKEDEKLGDEVSNLKKDEKKDAKASELFASLTVDSDQVIPPNASAPLESLKERWAAGFVKEKIKISN